MPPKFIFFVQILVSRDIGRGYKVMKLMESSNDEGNKSAITTDSERSDQGGRNG